MQRGPIDNQTETGGKGWGEKAPVALSPTLRPYIENATPTFCGIGKKEAAPQSDVLMISTHGSSKQSDESRKVLSELNGQPDTTTSLGENGRGFSRENLSPRTSMWVRHYL